MDQYTKDLEKRVEELESKIGAFNSIQKVVEIKVTRIVNKETAGTRALEFAVDVKSTRMEAGYVGENLYTLCRVNAIGFDKWEITDEFMHPEFFTQKTYECTESVIKETILRRLGLAAYEYTYTEMVDVDFPMLTANDLVSVQPMMAPVGKTYAIKYTQQKQSIAKFSKMTMPTIRRAYGKKK
jgi:hypothetical protein